MPCVVGLDRMNPNSFIRDKRSTCFLIVLFAIMLLLRTCYDRLEADQLAFLLQPSAVCIAGLTGSAYHTVDQVIAFPALGISLDKSCAGGHFLLMFAGFCLYMLRDRMRSIGSGIGIVLFVAAAAYVTAVLGNVSRVLLSIFAAHIDHGHGIGGTVSMHLVIGTLVQLLFLLLAYGIIH